MGAPKNANQELTTTEKAVLDCCRKHLARFHKLPTLRAMGEAAGITHTAALHARRSLEKKGFLEQKPITEMRLQLSAKGKKAAL